MKKTGKILLAALCCGFCMAGGLHAAAADAVIPGDINRNGTPDMADAVLLLRIIGEDPEAEIPDGGFSAADFDGNGCIDFLDYTKLLKLLSESGPVLSDAAPAKAAAPVWNDVIPPEGLFEYEDALYYVNADGSAATGTVRVDGLLYTFDRDGRCLNADSPIDPARYAAIADVIENAPLREEPLRYIDVWDNGTESCLTRTEFPTEVFEAFKGFPLTEEAFACAEEFAAMYFTEDMTLTEKLLVTHQWIHKNVDYAYVYTQDLWQRPYAESIFRNRTGQCLQYNGAMATMLAYFGFDVYMVKGCTKSGNQHYWTEVRIGEQRYYVETGNEGKNGSFWQYFFRPVAG